MVSFSDSRPNRSLLEPLLLDWSFYWLPWFWIRTKMFTLTSIMKSSRTVPDTFSKAGPPMKDTPIDTLLCWPIWWYQIWSSINRQGEFYWFYLIQLTLIWSINSLKTKLGKRSLCTFGWWTCSVSSCLPEAPQILLFRLFYCLAFTKLKRRGLVLLDFCLAFLFTLKCTLLYWVFCFICTLAETRVSSTETALGSPFGLLLV